MRFSLLDLARQSKEVIVVSNCGAGRLNTHYHPPSQPDVFAVHIAFIPTQGVAIHFEDRYFFAPGGWESNSRHQGPVDFVWSQHLKNEPDGLMPEWTFKSPATMLQQGKVFVALMADPRKSSKVPLAFDPNVTGGEKLWFSYGSVWLLNRMVFRSQAGRRICYPEYRH